MRGEFPTPQLDDQQLGRLIAKQNGGRWPLFFRPIGMPYLVGKNFLGHRKCEQQYYAEFTSDENEPGTYGTVQYYKEN